MKRYRLHDLLRAAAASWMAAACATPSGGAGAGANNDAQADTTALDAAPNSDSSQDVGKDAPADTPPDAAAETAIDAVAPADAAKDAAAEVAAPDVAVDAAPDLPKDVPQDAAKPDAAPVDSGKTGGPFACKKPQPVMSKGIDTGVDVCAGGMLRRRAIVSCPSVIPEAGKNCQSMGGGGPASQCATDEDCAGKAKGGHCEKAMGPPGDFCYCATSCVTDEECGAGQVCLCGEKYGTCTSATCKSAADCAVGDCVSYTANPGCGSTAMTCESADDGCGSKADCKPAEECTWDATKGHKFCTLPMCAIGRPYAVDGQWQTAPTVAGGPWSIGQLAAPTAVLPAETQAQLRAHFLAAAQMEHASVAAFAQLTLELLAVAAPPELVSRAQAAGMDEVRHAQACFGLARYFGAPATGPGGLPLQLPHAQPTLAAVAAAATREGCVIETVAALEARISAAEAADPVVAEVLAAIADDEARHAELSWDIVRWAWQQGDGQVRAAIVGAFAEGAALLHQAPLGPDVPPRMGVQAGPRLRAIRDHALREVVNPAMQRLLAS